MKFSFSNVPILGERPVVRFELPALRNIRLLGLVDSGATHTRLDSQFADALGVDLSDVPVRFFNVAGHHYAYRTATVDLKVGGYAWPCEVGFVQNWGWAHQVLGIGGFFEAFLVRIDATEKLVTLTPKRHPRTYLPVETEAA